MNFLKRRQKIPKASNFEGEKVKDPFQKVPPRIKVMTMFKTTEKVKRESSILALQCSFIAKQGSRISSMIRIQIEETKRKVRVTSPESLQFIGPGDHKATLTKRGGITS